MRKRFNDTGLCVPGSHYMVDSSARIKQITDMIDDGEYFTINRPRQYGKTTTLLLLEKALHAQKDYLALKISFEGIDTEVYKNQARFIAVFLDLLTDRLEQRGAAEIAGIISRELDGTKDMRTLSKLITRIVNTADRPLVLLIDEVDKSANNQLFLDFLAMLRNKYLGRNEGSDITFQSVILAGVHDIKNLKAKIHPDSNQKYNSPWNIAVDFKVNMCFNADEIAGMLEVYSRDKQISPDIPAIAERLYYYTSGYPYLVSKLCKFIDEEILPLRDDTNWYVGDVESAFRMITDEGYTTTLFDSLIKNLENDKELRDLVYAVIFGTHENGFSFTIKDPLINLGVLYGIFRNCEGKVAIDNRIYEQIIYDYMCSRKVTSGKGYKLRWEENDYTRDGILNIQLILVKFQEFFKEHYSHRDRNYVEREGRLLFLSFLKPIINGHGFAFKEPVVGLERRMDVVVTYENQRHVIELKIWRGDAYHDKGLDQLSDYLDTYNLLSGFLLIFDFNKKKEYKQKTIHHGDKTLFAVWV